ncbi:MAG TPA: alpha,alpha-trehalose-phosphate synthase (UDP-forming) [Methylibium sp.]|uniref:alpha,alpha-trehalose-phosphate synthase (UDP-forming) n=1 Tax=Methylibium sp. TaxID=2067992 RepID=UPI002DB9BCF5|nr:alpha,alpha-trehalose-phosphate synthase (UDP-forming) [Methylibium sp.]HEU4459491.1 alpha,alpha-trehalose-phosphate synthase (UDP-forming) [Methylibium sp.]
MSGERFATPKAPLGTAARGLKAAAGGGRLVVVSNRLADPRKPAAGGLAVAVGEALATSGGLWFGWSGKTADDGAPSGHLQVQHAGKVTLATLDLSRDDLAAYYDGYSNRVLWPVFHYRLDLAQFDDGHFEGYQRVNRLFAQKLLPLLRADDVIWVHDYHLIPLAAELRALGCEQRIGFFLHIPLPPPLILAAIPAHEWLIRSLFAYDLVGLQSQADVAHFTRYVQDEAGAEDLGRDHLRAFSRQVCVRAFPIGIDVEEFSALADTAESIDTRDTLREQYAKRQLLVGVDRLDYSKGIPQRLRAFGRLLANYPENRNSATLIQVATPTREGVGAYDDIRTQLELLAGRINGDYGELDWMPVRYIHRTLARKRLPGLYRAGRVALVTPLRDGMNLVAKEYVAAQDPADPGVLVLSRFTGAAEQLREALLVNPYDTGGTAEMIQRALRMSHQERVERHRALMQRVREFDVHWWRKAFLTALAEAQRAG